MRQLNVLLVLLAIVLSGLMAVTLGGCGGSHNTTITLSPTTVSVYTAQNQQFTATVTNATSTAVTWEVNGLPGGNSLTIGYVDAGGLYTAPATVPNPATVTITAISTADTSKTATATVTVLLGANLSISPSSLNLDAGAQQTFTVLSNGSIPATGVVYSLSCKSTVSGACGSITTDGIYTAPLSPPPNGGNVIVTATLTEGSGSFSTSATITIVSSAQSTTGQYAFTLAGKSNGSAYHAAGSVSLDGNGNITGGSEDVNTAGAASTVSITGGTYTYSPADGRIVANVQTSSGSAMWYMVLANRNSGYIEYAGSGVSASGILNLQDPTQFNAAAVNGNYAFSLAGFDTSSPPKRVSEEGGFTADGVGTVSSGLLDANTAGSLSSNQSVSGTFTAPSASGRGTLTIASGFGTQTFAYYVISATQLVLVETDGARSANGAAVVPSGGPYSAANFHGNLATSMNGASANGALGIGGYVTIGSGAVTGGSIDRNDAGTFTGGQSITGGTYTVTDATTGRTEATVTLSGGGSLALVLYPQSNTTFNMLEASTTESASGFAIASSGGNGSNSSLQGNYAANFTGVFGTAQEDIVGELIANGGGVFTGTLDISNGGANTSLQSSPYSVSNIATATLKSGFTNFNSIGFNLYIVDSTQALFLENDNKGVLTGAMGLQ